MASSSATQTQIYNRALILLGSVARVRSIDDAQPLARQLNDVWDGSRQAAIASHPWNFAIKRAQLNAHANKPLFGYSVQCALPADCLRWLPAGRGDYEFFEGEEEGGFILTDAAAPINIRYLADITDVGAWPPHFVTFMAFELAMMTAESGTQMTASVDDMTVKREQALMDAKRFDGLATGNRSRGNVETESRWLSARYGRSYGSVPGQGYR